MRRYRKNKLKSIKKAGPRVNINFQRVPAEVQIDSTQDVIDSRVFLHDLTPDGVGLFTASAIDQGELITLVIEQPKHLFVKGKVSHCAPYTMDRKIITAESFNYRVTIKFTFDTPEEQNNLKKFCEELTAPDEPDPSPASSAV